MEGRNNLPMERTLAVDRKIMSSLVKAGSGIRIIVIFRI